MILAVVLASLAYLGAFNLSSATPNSCIGVTGYICTDPILYPSGALTAKIGQVSTGPITVTGTACTTSPKLSSISSGASLVLEPEQTMTLVFQCPLKQSSVGSDFSGYLWIEYSNQNQQGIMSQVGKVQASVVSSNSVAYAPTFFYSTFGYLNGIDASTGATTYQIRSSYDNMWGYPSFAISSDGSYAYSAQSWGSPGFLNTINLQTGTVVNTIPGLYQAGTSDLYSVALSPNGQYAYVTESGNSGTANIITVDLSTYMITNTIGGLTIPYMSGGIVVSPDGSNLYLSANGELDTINLATDMITNTISGIAEPGMAISSDGKFLYTTGGAEIQTIDLSTDTISQTISVPFGGWPIALSPNGQYAYVDGNSKFSIVDLSTDQVTNTIPVSLFAAYISVSQNGEYAYIFGPMESSGGEIVTVNLSTDTIANVISLPGDTYQFTLYNPSST